MKSSFFSAVSIFLVISFLLLLCMGGCGRIVALSGEACTKDLEKMRKEGEKRFGCIVFPKTSNRKIYAVVYKGDQTGQGGQLYYCKSPTSCSMKVAFITQGAGGAEETAFLAFPPTETGGETNVKKRGLPTFLNRCANVFNATTPIKIRCDNEGEMTSSGPSPKWSLKNCWLLFFFKFNRKAQTGSCERLRGF